MTPESSDLIKKLIEPDPHSRLGANGIDEITSHPFFRDFDWKNLKKMDAPMIPKHQDYSSFKKEENHPFIKSRKSKNLVFDHIIKVFYYIYYIYLLL